MGHEVPSRAAKNETLDGAVSRREAAQRLLATLAPQLNGASDEASQHPLVDRSIGKVSNSMQMHLH